VTLLLLLALAELQIGDPARALDLPSLDGKLLKTEELRGRVTAVDFFATWCGPCQEAMAALDAIVRKDPRAQLVVVDVGEDPDVARAFFARRPLPPGARLVLDRDGSAGRRWGQRRFPTTFVLDAAGVVRHINRGFGPGYARRLDGWVAKELGP